MDAEYLVSCSQDARARPNVSSALPRSTKKSIYYVCYLNLWGLYSYA
jgi:hypothetical protein